jgi:hypothetical protein
LARLRAEYLTMPDERAHLRLADRHLAEAAERMARMRERIAQEWLNGSETDLAEQLLENFEVSMALMKEHRQQIVDAIEATRLTRVAE